MFRLMLEKESKDQRDYTKTLIARFNGMVISGPNANIQEVMIAIEEKIRESCEKCCRCDLRFDVGFPTDPVPSAREIEERVNRRFDEYTKEVREKSLSG